MAPTPATLLRQARAEARLTQRELSRRAGTAQSVVARVELGQTSPSWSTLCRLLAAAGFELQSRLVRAPGAPLNGRPAE